METLALPGRKTDRFLQMGMSKNLSRFQEWQQVYVTLIFSSTMGLKQFLLAK